MEESRIVFPATWADGCSNHMAPSLSVSLWKMVKFCWQTGFSGWLPLRWMFPLTEGSQGLSGMFVGVWTNPGTWVQTDLFLNPPFRTVTAPPGQTVLAKQHWLDLLMGISSPDQTGTGWKVSHGFWVQTGFRFIHSRYCEQVSQTTSPTLSIYQRGLKLPALFSGAHG